METNQRNFKRTLEEILIETQRNRENIPKGDTYDGLLEELPINLLEELLMVLLEENPDRITGRIADESPGEILVGKILGRNIKRITKSIPAGFLKSTPGLESFFNYLKKN